MSRGKLDLMDYLDPVDGDADMFEISESMAHQLQDEIDQLNEDLYLYKVTFGDFTE